MGHHDLRHDKECQNCGHIVELEYCSKCGQQNIETRQSFHHLITHIIEDITHYDGNFWKTIKYLLFRPGKLTIEYLMGHRMRYVPPVKLYIFISFVAFFLMAIMAPEAEEEHVENHSNEKITTTTNIERPNVSGKVEVKTYKSVHEFDSIQNTLPEVEKLSWPEYYTQRAVVKLSQKNITLRDFIITAAHTLPKVLFFYMPIFTFWLWLFHGKKRWMFFDHGIFTLHYFSFLLLLIIINLLLGWSLINVPVDDLFDTTMFITTTFGTLYSFFYFFRSHRLMYGETKVVSRLKSLALFSINFIGIMFTLVATLIYIVNNIH